MVTGTEPDYTKEFEGYIRRECLARITEIVQIDNDDQAHYGLEIDLMSVGHSAPHVLTAILNDPYGILPQLENVIQSVQESIGSKKKNIHARLCHLPATPQTVKRSISALRTRDLHKLISIIGTVTRTGSVILREGEREYVCSRCKHSFIVAGDITRRGAFDVPLRCPRPGEKPCYGNNFTPKQDIVPICQEYQEIKVQEKVQHLDVGFIPRSLIVVLTNDIVDTVKPGDDVVITGVLHRRWNKNLINGARVDVELMLLASHVASNNDHKSFLHVTEESSQLFAAHWASTSPRKQLEARNLIIKSICPQIYGMYLLKLIVAMTLTGGVSYTDPSGTRIRGESHLLMVGDPGTAKSQILRYAAKVCPRSVLTTGIGTTSAGLTVTAVREPGTGEWMLDAGALVLADGGVCCIDEFDGIKQHDRGAIHEAMEQQTLSVAKAGLVCTLDTRATVLAAVNPKGGRICTEIGVAEADDDDGDGEKLPITVGIASPLLSRFDVVLTLLDQRNEDWDKELSSFILNGYKTDTVVNNDLWPTDRLREYFYFIKNNLKPRLSKQCQRILSTYYTLERGSSRRNAARTTVRLLEALVRLAQAHARLMFRETATPLDAVFAIAAVEASSATQEIVGGMGALHAPFPEDPKREFEEYCRYLLCKLGLDDEEIDFYYDDAPIA
ncbi:DNA replication licensing factor MCM9 [Gracilaria domingensis]|nr:DNA replication licensing factor MCM9 [Gracilaria domingensis]